MTLYHYEFGMLYFHHRTPWGMIILCNIFFLRTLHKHLTFYTDHTPNGGHKSTGFCASVCKGIYCQREQNKANRFCLIFTS